MALNTKIVKGVKWTAICTIITAITSIVKISILTRYIDKADFGLIAIITFIINFVELFNDMGFTSAIIFKQNISKKEYASLYWLNMIMSFSLYILVITFSPLVALFYHQPQLNILLPLLGSNIIISGIGRQFKTIENKNMLFKEVSFIEMLAALTSFIFSIILALNNEGIYSLVYPSLLQYLLTNVSYLLIGLKKYGLLFHFNLKETKPFLKVGIYQVGGQVLNFLNRDLDILLIGRLFPSDVLGGYSLAKQLVFRPAQIINPILTKVASPALAILQNNREALKSNYLKLINIVSTLNFLVYGTLIIFAPWIIKLIYGADYQSITTLVRLLSVYMLFRAISNPIGSLVTATGRTDLEFNWNLATIIIMPIFVFFSSQLGIIYVGIALILSMIILFIPNWKLLVNKMTGASLNEYIRAITVFNKSNLSLLKK